MSKTALIIGATGLTGEQCLIELLASPHYSSITALTRTQLQTTNSEIKNIIVDFNHLHLHRSEIKAHHIYFPAQSVCFVTLRQQTKHPTKTPRKGGVFVFIFV